MLGHSRSQMIAAVDSPQKPNKSAQLFGRLSEIRAWSEYFSTGK